MKRLHIHVAVTNLPESIRFYSALFDSAPTVTKDDYAKWMLDDPRVNFAISQRSARAGLDHLGIQAESAEELAELGARLEAAQLPQLTQTGAACCYAESDKHWSVDPNGIAWETFHTLATIPTFGAESRREPAVEAAGAPAAAACCAPVSVPKRVIPISATPPGKSCC